MTSPVPGVPQNQKSEQSRGTNLQTLIQKSSTY
jgi:hypothetical protein